MFHNIIIKQEVRDNLSVCVLNLLSNIMGKSPSREATILPSLMVFVCHRTLQGHMIKALYDFMIRSLSRYITILASLVFIDIVVAEISWL